MSLRIRLSEISFYLGLVLLFFGGINLCSWQGYFFFASSVILIASIVLRGYFCLDFDFWLIVAFGLSYIACSWISGSVKTNDLVYFLLFPIAVYQIAHFEIRGSQKAMMLLCAFAGSFFARAILMIGYTTLRSGFSLGAGQFILDPWLNERIARTGLSIYLMPAAGLSAYYLLTMFLTKQVRQRWLTSTMSFFVILLSLLWSSLVGNRSPIAAALIFAILVALFKALRIKKKEVRYTILIAAGVAALFALALIFGFLPGFLTNLEVVKRFNDGGSNKSRIQCYTDFFTHFYRYPIGGTWRCVKDTYVHNFYLDIYNFGGILPFAFFTLLCVRAFLTMLAYQKTRSKVNAMYEYAFATMLGTLCLGLFEPIFQANQFTFGFFAIFFASGASLEKNEIVRYTKFKI
jgi:hypothetical protein